MDGYDGELWTLNSCNTILYWNEETPSANTYCIFDLSTDVCTLKHFDLCFQESSYSLPIAFSSTKYYILMFSQSKLKCIIIGYKYFLPKKYSEGNRKSTLQIFDI